ncbi:MAG TPA: WD40 repeat domain-containing protein [Cytophagaceae bacterium]|nr:WD40 repeat domain-containing protein [Cytophagaceae bacterium]
MSLIEVEKAATLTGHRDCIYSLEKAADEKTFFSAAGDGMVVLWNLADPENGHLIAKLENSVYALSYLPEKNQLLIGQNFNGVHLVDVASKKELRSAAITDSYIFDLITDPKRILAATGDGTLVVLSLEDLSTIAKLKLSDQSLRALALSPEGRYLVVGGSDHTIRILDAETLKQVKLLEGHTNSVFSVRFSPDGRYLLSGSRDAHLKIWDVVSFFEQKQSIVAHMYAINHIEYSPDGRYFATCSMDKSIKVWDAQEFRLLKVIDKARYAGHGTSVNKLYWSKFHNQLISCSDDRSISVWNIDFNQQ